MTHQKNLFLFSLLFSLIIFAFNLWVTRLPDVKSGSAPETEFSAVRAIGILRDLLQENIPHPVGSEANIVVRNRISSWLNEAGIENEVQQTWGCAKKWNKCAYVENIVAYLPGQEEGAPYVALMAHYDTETMTPGAGDDGSGVVTIMETARALKKIGPLRNPILLIFTDAEEVGQQGAAAFFEFHPRSKEIGVVINIEGSGTTGPSQILRTTKANGTLIDRYRDAASFPAGGSLAKEVFERMPNNTDYSIPALANIPSMEFAFAGERNHYHAPNDTVDNLNPRTVQHHGENILPTVIKLAEIDLSRMDADDLVYMSTFGVWFQWTPLWSYILLGVSFLLLVIAGRKQLGSPVSLLGHCTLVPAFIILMTSLFTYLMFALLDAINGTTVNWPAHIWPFRLVLFSSMGLSGFSLAYLANRYQLFDTSLLSAWIFWWILTLLLVLYLPNAANVLLIPLLPAAIILFLRSLASWRDVYKNYFTLATLIVVMPHTLGLALTLEETQGYRLIPVTFIFLALYIIALGPMVRGSIVKPVCTACFVLLLIGLVAASFNPLYSQWRPQHVNIEYIQNADEQSAYWRLISDNPIPPAMSDQLNLFGQDQAVFSWSDVASSNVAHADYESLTPPSFTVLADEPLGDGRRVKLKLRSERRADFIQIVLSDPSKPLAYHFGENILVPKLAEFSYSDGTHSFSVFGIQLKQEVELTIDFADNSPVDAYLLDGATRLPPGGGGIMAARPPLASPVGTGDKSLVYRRVSF
ncbi:MAG: M28 family peptidase [Gammaproteobacteria bacterium]|nr:M28 family peptidase [Gammaproteobacteria bacterium]